MTVSPQKHIGQRSTPVFVFVVVITAFELLIGAKMPPDHIPIIKSLLLIVRPHETKLVLSQRIKVWLTWMLRGLS